MNDGGPAYPTIDHTESGYPIVGSPGLTMLDWFAGMALSGLLADPDYNVSVTQAAEASYSYAEAMLAERERRMK